MKGCRADFVEPITIEHGEFLHAIRRLRREQLKKKEKRDRKPRSYAALRTSAESSPVNASPASSGFQVDPQRIGTKQKQWGDCWQIFGVGNDVRASFSPLR